MLDSAAILRLCSNNEFRISSKAFLLLQDWCTQNDADSDEVSAVMGMILGQVDAEGIKVFREEDMRSLLQHWCTPVVTTTPSRTISISNGYRTLQQSSMETTDAIDGNEYLDEISRLKQIIQIILNKHSHH